jgi:hypothetical protein
MFNPLTFFFKQSFLAKFYAVMALTAIICLGSCKKEETDDTPYTAISVVNASPTVTTYDIYLGTSKLNGVAIPAGGSVGYSQRVAGAYDLKYTIAGRTETAYTTPVNLATNAYHSFFLVGRTAALDGFLTTDDLSAVSETNAFIRFVNVSPDAPALDLFVKGGNAVVTNKTFKTASAFTQIAAGTYTFDVKVNSSGAVQTSTESVKLAANTYYTVIVKGLNTPAPGGLELPLGANVLVNSRL